MPANQGWQTAVQMKIVILPKMDLLAVAPRGIKGKAMNAKNLVSFPLITSQIRYCYADFIFRSLLDGAYKTSYPSMIQNLNYIPTYI